ncbi:K Homology domain type 1 [Penicillium chermesinum]|uniref:K Homology domain type 1 n=1 Tax=Penicillium chermesinum TaxID=63820 RepID=A0A9W9NTJ2_9EURO|nr:K Homology domain type 1 [Penicillium chermesinum]KAJ5225900.1 K Homology domain type 1 [Penicillium chermesinum]
MSAETSTANGGASSSLAAKLAAQHDAHNPTVEEVVDEEDLKHPPPSANSPSVSALESATPEESGSSASVPKPATKRSPAFDVQSEELFPALGSGPKPAAPAAATWGAKKPSAAAGVANGQPAKSLGMWIKNIIGGDKVSLTWTQKSPRVMSLPGKHMEQLRLVPSQMQPRGQLKKPLKDILRDISRKSKANVEMRGGPGGSVIFEGKGSVESVRQALREVAQQVGSKQSVRVPIPASARPHIIGRQGAVVQDLQNRTGARVQVPRVDDNAAGDDDENDTIDVLIEGDAVAAEMARREIEAIVKERSSGMNFRLKTIPPEFFPFLAGPHDSALREIEERTKAQVHVPRYDTWTTQPPPQEAHPGQVQFVAVPDKHIVISGERAAAQEARAEIERLAAELQQKLTLRQLAINRVPSPDWLCNCPSSPSDDSEFLTITGPVDQIEAGVNHAMELATSMQMASIDLSRQHAAGPAGPHAHARALTQYLQRRQIIQQLEAAYDARIALPRASMDLSLGRSHPPSRLRHIPVDPYFHPYLRSRSASKLQGDYGVHLLVPDDIDSPEVVLVYEGPSASAANFEVPRQRPSPADVAAFEKSLQAAQEYLLSALGDQLDIVAKTVSIPAKYQEKARKFIIREQDVKGADSIPVRAIIGEPKGTQVDVALRGPSGLVAELAAKLEAFVVEQEKDDLERGYTVSFDFPQKYANFLIGKRGENINKLREEFDVDIKVENGKVEVKGPKAKADATRMRIINLGKKLEDETTHILKIPAQYHRELIGQRGNQVNRLQDRYNVRVQFPRATVIADDQSVTENGSDAGGSRARPQQAVDEVLVKGPSKGADSARDEILSLLQWVTDHSHTATVSVAQSQVASLIGQRGREMDKLRADTGAQIDVPSANDAPDASGRVQIRVKGTKQQVAEAKKILQQRASEFDATVTKSIEVDKKYHKALIGGGGANIRKIVVDAGGPNDGSAARIVRFPRPESTESTIRLEGNGQIVDNIIAAIQEFVKEREDQVTEALDVPTAQHRLLIGRGGETRRGIESKFNVTLDIPKQGSGRTDVKLKGPSGAVAEAKEHIQGLLKQQHAETVFVPTHLHHAVADNGAFFRRLRSDHQVTVDHAGKAVPSNAVAEETRSGSNGTALPLITDDPSESADAHSWNVIDNSNAANADTTPFPWVLTGSPENVAKARAAIEKAIAAASQQSATGYLILPDPKTYRFVVGQGGSQINAIRKKTGCRINVPKDQARGEAIEIRGSSAGLEEAKNMILEAVQNGLNGSSR